MGRNLRKQKSPKTLIILLQDQKKREYEQLKQRLMESMRKELHEFQHKLEAQIPQDPERMKHQWDQMKAALKEQTKKELEQKRTELKADLKQLVEQKKKEWQEKMRK